MANLKGTGLLMVWCEVPDDVEDEFNRWYNEEHIEERLSIPGILSAARYEAVVSGPKHLAVYELESSDVMTSEAYRKVRSNPTEWSKRMSPEYSATTYVRNVYEMIHPQSLTDEIASSPMAPALQIGRMDIPADVEAEWNDWYNAIYVPNYETVDGVRRGRRYRTVTGVPRLPNHVRVRRPRRLQRRSVAGAANRPPRQRPYARSDDTPARVPRRLAQDVRARGVGKPSA